MKRVLLLLILTSPFVSHGQLLWQKTFRPVSPTGQTEHGRSLVTYSNGEIITSTQYFFGLWVMKLDTAGNVLWSKNIPDTGVDKVIKAKGDNLVFGSASQSAIAITKTDTSANVIWSKEFDFDERDYFADIIETDNGNLIVVGASNYTEVDSQYSYYHARPIAFCLDSSGTLLWAKSYYPYVMQIYAYDQNTAVFQSIKRINSNEYLISVTIADTVNNENGMLVMKIDTLGNVLNSIRINSPRNDWSTGCLFTYDNHIMIYGNTYDTLVPGGWQINSRPIYAFLDNNLTALLLMNKIIINGEVSQGAIQYQDSSILLYMLYAGGLMKLDPAGNYLYLKSIGISSISFTFQVNEYNESIFIIGMEWTGNQDFFLVKALNNLDGGCNTYSINTIPVVNDSAFTIQPFTLYESALSPVVLPLNLNTSIFPFTSQIHCNTAVGLEENIREQHLLLSPNPVKRGEPLSLFFNAQQMHENKITIYDMLGNQLISEHIKRGSTSLTIVTDLLTPGVYVAALTSTGNIISKIKLIVI